jgi:hypothetical protein
MPRTRFFAHAFVKFLKRGVGHYSGNHQLHDISGQNAKHYRKRNRNDEGPRCVVLPKIAAHDFPL